MARLAATLPGYASVARASEVLHLAPRSVRDLIYAGRMPSLRIGRLHYIRAADLEQERRRRLGLPRRQRISRAGSNTHRPRSRAPRNRSLDSALRRQRATERAELVSRWAQRHAAKTPSIPVHVLSVDQPITCEACERVVRHGRYVSITADSGQVAQLCTTCGRRALLDWADRRRQEAAAARHMAQSLGEPEATPVDPRPAELLQQVLLPPQVADHQEPAPGDPRAA